MSQITVEKTAEDSASKSLRVTVPVDRVQEAEAKALKYYVQRARLPGFRQGKAPEAVVRKRFGDAIRQSVLEEVIRESWETAKIVRVAQADHRSLHPEPQVRRRQPDRVRAAGRGPARAQARAHRRLPGRAPGRPGGRRRGRGAARPAAGAEGGLDPGRGRQALARPDGPGRGGAASTRRRGGRRRSRTTWCSGQNQAIPDLEERIMTLLPGRAGRRRGQVSRRPSRRVPAGPDPPGAGHPARREAPGAARRSTTPSPARSATSRASTRSGRRSGRTWSARPTREADAQVRQALIQQIVEANNVQAPESLVHRLMHGYAEMYRVPQEQLRAVRAAVPPGRRGAGPARPGARRGGRGQRAPGHRGRAGRADRRAGRGARRARRPALRQRCRRPTGCPSSSAPSPRRRRSPGSSSSPQSTRRQS